uniref:Selenoprotein M n=1 Tax=Sinocyclocheilus rhinocerous TaxID=307959 RepID=A0A673JF59_9TELE
FHSKMQRSFYNLLSRTVFTPSSLFTSLQPYILHVFTPVLKLHHPASHILNIHPFSHNLVMKHIPGADPELVLLNHYYEELDRIPLSEMTRTEINKLLAKLGFYKKENPEDPVPEEFRLAPAKDSPFEDTTEKINK